MKLEDLTGWVEYDVLPPGHPDHFVARARMAGRLLYPRPEDSAYPHPYRSAWNAEASRFVTVTQESLDDGTIRPIVEG